MKYPFRLISILLVGAVVSACSHKTSPPLTGRATIVNPVVGYTLLLKEPDISTSTRDSMIVGKIMSGSEVDILDSKKDPSDLITLYRVRVTSGSMSGKEGWVSDQSIKAR